MKCSICNENAAETVAYGRTFYKCETCGFVFTPDYDEKAQNRGMGMEGSWSGPGGGGHREYCIVKILQELFGMRRFLLFGTGNTNTLDLLLREGVDAVGSDISRDVVAYKKKAHGDDRFHSPDQLPKSPAFDAIVAVEVFEHFTHPLESFEFLLGHLNDGGIIAGTTDFHPGGPIEDGGRPGYMEPRGHVAYWSLSSLSGIASRFGRSVSAFEMVRPGSLLPDEKFNRLWPNKRVFFIHDDGAQRDAFRELREDLGMLDITMP